MNKDEALKLAAEMERGQFSTTLLPAAAELRRLHEENQKLRAQLALDKMAENARELGLDYEPEQKPVAWVGLDLDGMVEAFHRVIEEHYSRNNPFHDPVNGDAMLALRELRGLVAYMKRNTTPPQRKPLTDEEIGAILEDINAFGTRLYTFARAIEAAHGIKGEA